MKKSKLLLTGLVATACLGLGACATTSTGEKVASNKDTTDWIKADYFRGSYVDNLVKYRKLTSTIYELVYEYSVLNYNYIGGGYQLSWGNASVKTGNNTTSYPIKAKVTNCNVKLTWTRYFQEVDLSGYFINAAPGYKYDGQYKCEGTFAHTYKYNLVENKDLTTALLNHTNNVDMNEYFNNLDNWTHGTSYQFYNATACYTYERTIDKLEVINGSTSVSLASAENIHHQETVNNFSIKTYLGQ